MVEVLDIVAGRATIEVLPLPLEWRVWVRGEHGGVRRWCGWTPARYRRTTHTVVSQGEDGSPPGPHGLPTPQV